MEEIITLNLENIGEVKLKPILKAKHFLSYMKLKNLKNYFLKY